jgi:CRP/FNR family transcriptional regulator, cyclic AMP receptor protein
LLAGMESACNTSCFSCELRPDRKFCDLPSDALQAFDTIKRVALFPRGATLFAEDQPPKGIYVLCDGRAKLCISSENGKKLMLRMAGPGELLGLSATLSGRPYEVTAETVDASQVVFIKRRDLLRFLRDYPSACMQIVGMLSGDLHTAYERVRSIGLARTRKQKAPAPRARV